MSKQIIEIMTIDHASEIIIYNMHKNKTINL